MRLRNVANSIEEVKKHDRVIQEPKDFKGKWKELFNNEYPINIEIGMGKGQFIINQAKLNQAVNFIGFEKYSSVLYRALKKIEREAEELNNLVVVRIDIEEILDIFGEGEINRIYLNFSDPWPKERHAKRRLTHINFLNKYKHILKDGGEIVFKTDNEPLFNFSVEQFELANMEIINYTTDLHNSKWADKNIKTEYEEKFSKMGNNIYMLKAISKKK